MVRWILDPLNRQERQNVITGKLTCAIVRFRLNFQESLQYLHSDSPILLTPAVTPSLNGEEDESLFRVMEDGQSMKLERCPPRSRDRDVCVRG